MLKTDPHQAYMWHRDENRGLSVNLLLTPGRCSHCLFDTPTNEYNLYFTELDYAPRTFYLFNTQIPHTVINFGEPRYLFSVEFVAPLAAPGYSGVVTWAHERGLLDDA